MLRVHLRTIGCTHFILSQHAGQRFITTIYPYCGLIRARHAWPRSGRRARKGSTERDASTRSVPGENARTPAAVHGVAERTRQIKFNAAFGRDGRGTHRPPFDTYVPARTAFTKAGRYRPLAGTRRGLQWGGRRAPGKFSIQVSTRKQNTARLNKQTVFKARDVRRA